MMDWYDRACEQLEQDYDDGTITEIEYQRYVRELNEEYKEYLGGDYGNIDN